MKYKVFIKVIFYKRITRKKKKTKKKNKEREKTVTTVIIGIFIWQ